MYLSREETETLAQEVAASLETRTFAKHPHIGLIGPGTRGTETDPMDLLSEVVEEQSEQWLSPFVSGFRVSMHRIRDSPTSRIKACFSFSLRISPPSTKSAEVVSEAQQFRSVDLCFDIGNGRNFANVALTLYDGTRETELYSHTHQVAIQDGKFRVRIPEGEFSTARNQMTTSIDTGYGSRQCTGLRFCYGFGLSASLEDKGMDRYELSARLTCNDGSFEDSRGRIIDVDEQNIKCRNQGIVDRQGKAWSVAQLHEVHSVLRVEGYRFAVDTRAHGIAGIRPINCAYDLSAVQDGEIRFADFAIVPERGSEIQRSQSQMDEFLRRLTGTYGIQLGISSANQALLVDALSRAIPPLMEGSNFLYTFQEDCATKILQAVSENRAPASAVPISVQTAGGKTLGFLIPIAMFCFLTSQKGVKALLFYPTKALINDQSDTILKLLWHLNRNLADSGYTGAPVSIGILHGDTLEKRSRSRRLTTQPEVTENLRLKCPLCSSPLAVTLRRVGTSGVTESVRCSATANTSCVLSTNSALIQLLNSMIRVVRESVYSNPPDILVSTPDMINLRLFFDPSQQAIFGRRIKRCQSCGYHTANVSKRGACPDCGSELTLLEQLSSPRILVFDEAHQLRGSFGSQVSHTMSRFEKVVRTVSGSSDYRPVYVFSSATLAEPSAFVTDFFGLNVPTKELVRAQYIEESSIVRRVHLFMVPKGYSPEATLVQTLVAIFRNFPIRNRHPNVLIFVNSLAESNELIHLIRHHRTSLTEGRKDLPLPEINGHSTDYGNKQREEVEDDFTRGTINVLVATTTLQVGVDFNRIDALIVYGAPFYLSDFVQRIGRAGRKHAALIVSILPSKPVDFFFFGNYPLITDQIARDKALNSEMIRVSRENERVRARSAVRAMLDFLCTRQDSYRYFGEEGAQASKYLFKALFGQNLEGDRAAPLNVIAGQGRINPELVAYINEAMRAQPTESELSGVYKTINKINELLARSGILNLSKLYQSKQLRFLDSVYAGDLRQSDYMVRIEHPDLEQVVRARGREASDTGSTRERALSIAIGDYSPGQVTSYRSIFFVVDHIESDPSQSSAIRDAIYTRGLIARRSDL